MKKKQNARERREASRKDWKPEKDCPKAVQRTVSRSAVSPLSRVSPEEQARIEAEEAKLFLEYLENTKVIK